MSRARALVAELGREIFAVSWTLYKLMIPVILLVKLLEELGGVELLARLLSPVMEWVGLPGATGLVWAATLATNIYAGMLVFYTLPLPEGLSVAQVTVLGSLMLIAHSLPIEARIAQQAGLRLGYSLLLRIGGGLLFGWLLYQLYRYGGGLDGPVRMLWTPPPIDRSLAGWALAQLQSLAMIQLVIVLLLGGLKLLRLLGIERLMHWLLQPLLRLLGIGRAASTLAIVGITLGLTFGGGLLIREAQTGQLSQRDLFTAMTLLSLCHSLIEDTLLVLLLGADLSGILWGRLLFSLLAVALLGRLFMRLDAPLRERWLCAVPLGRPPGSP